MIDRFEVYKRNKRWYWRAVNKNKTAGHIVEKTKEWSKKQKENSRRIVELA